MVHGFLHVGEYWAVVIWHAIAATGVYASGEGLFTSLGIGALTIAVVIVRDNYGRPWKTIMKLEHWKGFVRRDFLPGLIAVGIWLVVKLVFNVIEAPVILADQNAQEAKDALAQYKHQTAIDEQGLQAHIDALQGTLERNLRPCLFSYPQQMVLAPSRNPHSRHFDFYLEMTVGNDCDTATTIGGYVLEIQGPLFSASDLTPWMSYKKTFKVIDNKGKVALELPPESMLSMKTAKPVERGDSPTGWLWFILDTTDRRRLEAKGTRGRLHFHDFRRRWYESEWWPLDDLIKQKDNPVFPYVPGAEPMYPHSYETPP